MNRKDQNGAVVGGGRRGRLGSPFFPLNLFGNRLRRGGVQWKRIVLGRGEGGPASQYWALLKNTKETGPFKNLNF